MKNRQKKKRNIRAPLKIMLMLGAIESEIDS